MEQLELKDYLHETKLIQGRLFALGIILILLVLTLMIRVWYLQVYQHEKFDVLSKDNRVRLVAVPPIRGQIYDRKGRVLAENLPIFTLEIVPDQVADMRALLDEVARIVMISPNQLKRFEAALRSRPGFEAHILKLNLSEEEVARFMVNQHRFPGAQVQARLQRSYPYGGELVHVLGYVGRINQREKDSIDPQAYKGTEYIGKLGIEEYYESELLGKVGFEQIETNAHGRPIRTLDRMPAVSGNDLVLNIDAELQVKARQILGDRRGSVIAIEPATGGVLAFVSNPTYDPNKFVNGIDHRSYGELRDDPQRPLLNRALYGRYAPGSTIKQLVALAGLENGWSASQQVSCPGYYQLKGSSHRYRCWKRVGHGPTNLISAIMKSCDVFFYQMANSLGIDKLHDFLGSFGLGSKTGIDLRGEPDGLMPSREWKRRVKGVVWYPGETLITGIGQGFTLATPLQLGVMSATMANRGQRVEPRIINHMVEGAGDGYTAMDFTPVIRENSQVEFNQANFDTILEGMRGVVESPEGTAHYYIGRDKSYSMAGKTGTAQVVNIAQGARYDASKLTEFQKDHALFVAFAPVEEPKIAIAVIVENGGGGSSVAAPIARQIFDYYLAAETNEESASLARVTQPDSGL